MNKHYYSPLEMLTIATQHAYAAEYLLDGEMAKYEATRETQDTLLPMISLIHTAFQLTLRANLAQAHRPIKQDKTLSELLELNYDLSFSSQDLQLLKTLTRQLSFRKGIDQVLWENRQEQHVFCREILKVYYRLQDMMPLELQKDYAGI